MDLTYLFCKVDDFCKEFISYWKKKLIISEHKKRNRGGKLSLSERLTIMIHFHQSDYKTFKHYYKDHACKHLKSEFPELISYTHFVTLMPSLVIPFVCLIN